MGDNYYVGTLKDGRIAKVTIFQDEVVLDIIPPSEDGDMGVAEETVTLDWAGC